MEQYKVYIYQQDASIVVIDLYNNDWEIFDKGIDDAFAYVTEHPKERYDFILKVAKVHTKGQPLQHFKRVGVYLKKHPEVVGIINVTPNPPLFFKFFDMISEVVIRVVLNRKVPTGYVSDIETAVKTIAKWREGVIEKYVG